MYVICKCMSKNNDFFFLIFKIYAERENSDVAQDNEKILTQKCML